MTTLDDKLLGEKLQYYYSTSEDEDSDHEDKDRGREPQPVVPRLRRLSWQAKAFQSIQVLKALSSGNGLAKWPLKYIY